MAPDRRIELEIEPDSGPLVVSADDARLRQVIGNLVTNALTHTPPDGTLDLTARAGRFRRVVPLTFDVLSARG